MNNKIAKLAEDQIIFLHNIAALSPKLDIALVEKALHFASAVHAEQTRISGELYIYHPMEVAMILAELKMDTSTIITALLHDTMEDCAVTFQEIEEKFGYDIAKLVDGVTKLAKIEYQPEHVKQAENFRKLFIAISEDIRVLLVKLADRLHNMRTLSHRSPDKRIKIAHETMEIYSPLAERMGIHKFKNELQDLAFAILSPDAKKSINSRLKFLRRDGMSLVETIIKEIEATLQEQNIKAEVTGREKTACSIWRKMENKSVTFEQLSDIIAFRIIVNTIPECYHALGAIHSRYHMIPGEFKDFISTPKANNYQSLHTVVMGPEQRCVEIQIRTHEMNEVAELGIAAHWAYKQGQNANEGMQYRWIRVLLEILENASDAEEFLEHTKLEMYYDQVFCFTPKGELIALPKGATAVDFAFAVHTALGLKCIGAKVNGRIVPLKHQLHNGDQVEILKSKTAMPSPTWERFVVTGKARAEIRKFVRLKQQQEYVLLGRALLAKICEENGQEFHEQDLKKVLKHFQKDSTVDLLAEVGDGIISRTDVFKVLFPEANLKKKKRTLSLLSFAQKKPKDNKPMPIAGLIPGMAVHFGGCCHPLPGDRIVGIVNSGKGITIHTHDCEVLDSLASSPERWLDVSWDMTNERLYVGRIKVTLSHEVGNFAEIFNAIAMEKLKIMNIKVIARSLDFFEILVDVETKNLQQLNALMTGLRALHKVYSVDRYHS